MSRPPGRPRVVFDCNAIVQAIAFDNSPACEAFRLAETGYFELFVSKATLSDPIAFLKALGQSAQ